MKHLRRIGCLLLTVVIWGAMALLTPQSVAAASMGMHVLHPEEFSQVAKSFAPYRDQSEPLYVTVPFTYDDRSRLEQWQLAFNQARELNIIPLVRIATRFDSQANAWLVPTRYEMLLTARALNALDWPQEQRHIILFNEPNHHAEWGGQADPESFADITAFAADWFQTESAEYVVLPAAMDLAAPNGSTTMEAFTYWNRAIKQQPELLSKIDAWNSHSYPNPGFTGSPTATGKNSLYGFEHERRWWRQHTDTELPIFITETGWDGSRLTARKLQNNYEIAQRQVWDDEAIVAVTPFVFAGSPGPFAGFSFVHPDTQFTPQWQALVATWKKRDDTSVAERPQGATIAF